MQLPYLNSTAFSRYSSLIATVLINHITYKHTNKGKRICIAMPRVKANAKEYLRSTTGVNPAA